ncbi:BGTF surface domain-containing protein [Haloarculaceae archaeon H-GB2-1]|nr:BGTF surface domain-containing protein [Haloarculaceae archaeon H-GB11]MEA5410021.1 BGTF surface domain-containing protein [Haloarculaceae archaeon H-GB2-1]
MATRPTTLALDSNRGTYTVTVSEPNLSESQLASVFEEADAVGTGDGNVTVQITSHDADIPLDLSAVRPGTYTFRIDVTDSAATETITVTRLEESHVDAAVPSEAAKTSRGGMATVPIRLGNADAATVRVGSQSLGYVSTVEVVDSDGDGLVVLRMNTWLAGRSTDANRRAFGVDDGTARRVALQTPPLDDPPLEPALYDVRVSVDGERKTSTYVGITGQPTEAPSTVTAPSSSYSSLETLDDLNAAASNRTLTSDATVARGDVIAFDLQAPGLLGAIAAERDGDESAADAFVDLVAADAGFEFRIRQRDPPPNRRPARVDLAATNAAGGLHAIPVNGSNRLFLVIDTDRMALTSREELERRLQPGAFRANLTLDPSTGVVDERRSHTSDWELVEQEVTLDSGDSKPLRLRSATCQRVSGTSSLAPGSQVAIVLRSTDDEWVRIAQPTVESDGRFDAEVNLSSVPGNATFVASVRSGPDAEVRGTVVDGPPAGVRIENQSVAGGPWTSPPLASRSVASSRSTRRILSTVSASRDRSTPGRRRTSRFT